MNSNMVCDNTYSDFLLSESSLWNSGDENICDNPYEWNDMGASDCTYACSGGYSKGDPNYDGIVSDFELLDYIDLWTGGEVTDYDLLEVIDNWAG